MRDIKEEIKQNSEFFIPRTLVELVNTSINKKISSADILKYLNSESLYDGEFLEKINKNRQLKVESVHEAIEIFGPENCSFLLMNALLFKTVENFLSEEIKSLFEMQLFTASASYIIAKETKIAYPHTSYSSGLLSNISYFYLARYHPEKLSKILAKNKNMVKRMTYEWETFGIDHAEMSYLILGSAGIMPEIYNPVRYHHQKNLQENIGSADTVKDVSLSLYFGSILTNMFYEDLGLVTDFRKDMKNMTGLHSRQLGKTTDDAIDHFKKTVISTDIEELNFPGYFKIISWFDTKLAVARSQVELAEKKNTQLNLQNEKYQKALSDNNKKLVDIALTDPLTGAYNRRYLDEKLRDEFKRAKRYNQSFILISCDIDHFKKINDNHGHAFGDTVLVKIVQIIKSSIRKTDYISRTGGEEFIIVCHSSNELGGIIIAEKIRKIIENTNFQFGEIKVPVTMSFGVVNYFPEVKSAEELIRISDNRLYAAKNAGRNKVIFK